MPATIRLLRQGRKKKPQYLIVATDKASRRDGQFLEKIGRYEPKVTDPKAKITIDMTRLQKWTARGAKISETVGQLIKHSSK